MDKYYKLAQLIRLGAKDIAKSDIAKRYYMQAILEVPGYAAPVLEAEDDSGYRAIILGDVYKNKGYCYLYTENADEDGNFTYKCFPPVKVIADRLRAIANKETFYVIGDRNYTNDVSAYDSNGVMRTEWLTKKHSKDAINYFSEVVNMFADKLEADPRSAKEIFEVG